MSKNKSPLLNESFFSEKTSEMLPMNLKVSQSKLNYEEKVYIPTTVRNRVRNRKQYCFRRFFPYIALFQIIMLIILLILYFCFPNLFYSNMINSNIIHSNTTNFNTSNSTKLSSNILPQKTQKTEVTEPMIINYTTEKTEVTEPIIIPNENIQNENIQNENITNEPTIIPNENITNADKTNTTKELETQTIMIPSTDQTQTTISSTENDTVSSSISLRTWAGAKPQLEPRENAVSLQLASTSETITQVLENSDKREHDNEEFFTTEMETITTEIETSSTIPHLRSLPIKSELSMETTDEETDEE